MTTKNLLVELLVEELPPKALQKLGESFATALTRELSKEGLLEAGSVTTPYASPRRLAAHITNVRGKAPTKRVRKKLMPVSVAFEDGGSQTAALKKRLEKENCTGSDLVREMEGNTEYVFLDFEEDGWSLSPLLNLAFRFALSQLPIPKVMGYQLHENCEQPGWTTVNFVRPAHKLVALHGSDVVEIDILGLQAGRDTHGHRFEAASATVVLKSADSYEVQMEAEGSVIPNFEKRRAEIARQLAAAATKENLKHIEDDALLDEVTALVERPNVLVGKFEKEFLEVPQECLILTMKANQKYFPLLDNKGKLTNRFLIVSNIRPADASLVIGGNERVVRPRLADAKFFFDQDRKKSLASRVEGLRKVVYHNKLGTQGERVERVWAIAQAIGLQLGGDVLAAQAGEAAMLAKADLLTDMVGEFPELQGIMGRYYAKHDGLSDDIAFAIEDHYKPRFAGDELPRNMVGVCVALADKLETLVGMFGIGQIPTGDKDPFALRRHALGVLRMLIEKELQLRLSDLVDIAFDSFPKELLSRQAHTDVEMFMFERLGGLLREYGYSTNQVEAVLCLNPTQIYLVPKQLEAVRAFAALPEAAALAAANKRVGNILKKVEGGVSSEVNAALLKDTAEQALHQALSQIAPKANAAFAAGDYTVSLQALAALRTPVDAFFDNVMVNVEDTALRGNRLALLAQLHQAMNRVADISKLAT
ncbi:MAG: glycine--tRNA ligase subunit beta [Gallionella sp.]